MRDSPIIQQFIMEAAQSERRKALLEVLEIRFGAEAVVEFREALERVENLDTLRALFTSAVQARRMSQLRRAIVGLCAGNR